MARLLGHHAEHALHALELTEEGDLRLVFAGQHGRAAERLVSLGVGAELDAVPRPEVCGGFFGRQDWMSRPWVSLVVRLELGGAPATEFVDRRLLDGEERLARL